MGIQNCVEPGTRLLRFILVLFATNIDLIFQIYVVKTIVSIPINIKADEHFQPPKSIKNVFCHPIGFPLQCAYYMHDASS
jgi:hypothetical protein